MTKTFESMLPEILKKQQEEIFSKWMDEQLSADTLRLDLLSEEELRQQSRTFLGLVVKAAQSGNLSDIHASEWQAVRDFLVQVARTRAERGFTASETATFLMSLKHPLLDYLRDELSGEPERLSEEFWVVTVLLDRLALYATELFQRGREEVIKRQQQDLMELSTPVVQLWEGVVAVPLIGTLDSIRTQMVMENLLQKIVDTGSDIAIIDITGVPMVDTLVAQHLLKTVAAARLMGAECIISGIRPQIAQTIVQLGAEFTGVRTKASLAGAFEVALKELNFTIQRAKE